MKQASGAKLLYENMRLAGRPTAVSTLMPSNGEKGASGKTLSSAFLCTPALICIVQWGVPALALSTETDTNFEKDLTSFRILNYANSALERPDTCHSLLTELVTS